MYKQKNTKNWRSSRTSHKKWSGKNRKLRRENIAASMYISKPENTQASAYIPENTFYDFKLHGTLAKNIADRDYVNPTKIQDQAIPEILKGKDVLGIASTGSGKTGAFLIPMIDKALKTPATRVLIVSPTRELTSQIYAEFKKFAQNTRLNIVLVIGGASIRDQIRLLKSNPQFVVATPGRLIDLEKRHCINLSTFNNVVLDEVDQMLDMGFVEDIKRLIAKLSPQRQSLFFSATLAQKEEIIANTLLVDPVRVQADKQSPLKNIHQGIVQVKTRAQKLQVLQELLQKQEFNKVLVFAGTKAGVDFITQEMQKQGIRAGALHGDKSQRDRSKVLTSFRQNKIDVLIATDVASRGIDIPNISHVINYDEPGNYNDYIHRIGRTGRLGKKGTAITFVLSKYHKSYR